MASPAAKQILLADYMDSLASLPNELTRSFSDLRELDAVLRSEPFHARVHLNPLLTESAPRPSVHRINNSKNPSTYLHDRNERHYTWGAPEPSSRDCSRRSTPQNGHRGQDQGVWKGMRRGAPFAVMLSTQSHSLLTSCLLVDHHSPTGQRHPRSDCLGGSALQRHAPGAFDDIPPRCPRITASSTSRP